MVPKALALQSAERTALWVSPAIEAHRDSRSCRSSSRSTRCGDVVMRADRHQRGEVAEEERYHSTEELQLIIQESQDEGLLRGESGRILASCSSSATSPPAR